MMKILTVMMAVFLGTIALSGCNDTWQGAGRDVEDMGERMQDPNR